MDTGFLVTVLVVVVSLIAVIYLIKRLTRTEESETTHPYDSQSMVVDSPADLTDSTELPVVMEKRYEGGVGSYYGGASSRGYENSEARKRREGRETRRQDDDSGSGFVGGVLVADAIDSEPVRTSVPLVSPDPTPEPARHEHTFAPSYPTSPAPVHETPRSEPSSTSFSSSDGGFSGSSESYSGGGAGSSFSSGGSGSSYGSSSSDSSSSSSSDSGSSSSSSSD